MSELFRDFLDRKFNEVIDSINQTIDSIVNGSATSIYSRALRIKTGTFQDMPYLTNVDFPIATYIGSDVFRGDTALTILDFPKVSTLGTSTFQGCSNLETLILRSNTRCVIYNTNTFAGTKFSGSGTGGKLYVPQALISQYQANAVWSAVLALNANNQILAIEGSPYEN